MATYNGAKYLQEQIDSILNQDLSAYPNAELEIIVSDDMSTDNTIKILEDYHDERIKIFRHTNKRKYKHNAAFFSCTSNFGNALEKATGEYIFLSDQDDIWHPLKISKSLDVLVGGQVNMCASGFDVVTTGLKKIGRIVYKRDSRWTLKRKNLLYGFSMGFNRKELNSYLPMPNIPHHDTFMTLVSSFKNNYALIDEALAQHRWSGQHNVSASIDDSNFLTKNYYRVKMVIIAYYRFLKSKIRQ